MPVPVSIEFFPPSSSKGFAQILQTAQKLNKYLQPEYFSVTYGAGGSTRDNTKKTVQSLFDLGLNVAPHLSLGGDDDDDIVKLLQAYKNLGIDRLVALRGDAGDKTSTIRPVTELIKLVRGKLGDSLHIVVASYPETHPNAESAVADLNWLKSKLDAGAQSAITQFFYNPNAYEDFLERCVALNITAPIVPGIMPIYDYAKSMRFAAKCGAEIPRWIVNRMQQYQNDPKSLQSFGIDMVSHLCAQLIDLQAPALHFFCLNKANISIAICHNLKLTHHAV